MPWSTPTLATVRQTNRDYITGKLQKPLIPNDYPRVLADANAGNAHLALQYLDWVSEQLLPDTAEKRFLDKWANIFLINADGSRGRKSASYTAGTITIGGLIDGTVLPQNSQLTAPSGSGLIAFETTQQVTLGAGLNTIPVRALVPGAASNLDPGTALSLTVAITGIDASSPKVVALAGGADQERDDELRARVLARICLPPMGGDADDYVNWVTRVAGVTRAWCSPLEMGMGTVTIRFMCDDLRAASGGLPTEVDIAAVTAYLNTARPVAVKDIYIVPPILQPFNFTLENLVGDSIATRAAIRTGVVAMLKGRASPAYSLNGVGQPAVNIPPAWVSEAIYSATNGASFDLAMSDVVMQSPGCMATLGSIL